MKYYSQVEAAETAMVSPGTLNTAIRKGLVPEPTFRFGGRRRFYDEATRDAVVEYFRRRRERLIDQLRAKNAPEIGTGDHSA